MSLLAVPILTVAALVCSILSLAVLFIITARGKVRFTLLESQWQANELLLNNLQLTNNTLQNSIKNVQKKHECSLLEHTQVSKQLEHRINTLKIQLHNQQESIILLQDEKSDDKFYSRAIKLAKKGAAIDEIVDECELPYAEVEMLLSIYQKNSA